MTDSNKALRHESGTGIRDSIVEAINDHADRIDKIYVQVGELLIDKMMHLAAERTGWFDKPTYIGVINEFLSRSGIGPWVAKHAVATRMSADGNYSVDNIHLDTRDQAVAVCAALNWLEKSK